jgi:hypothetical protein
MKHATIAVVLLLPSLLFAQGGKAGLSFLKLGVGGRSLAMAEAAVSTSTDPSAAHYNPAGLRLAMNPQLMIMHKEWIQGSQTEFLGGSIPFESFSVGFQVNATSIPEIEIRQRPGPAEGTFAARNAAVGISGAYSIDESISIGATLKYLYEKILVDEAGGVGLDIGGLYRSPWNVAFGASVANMGSMGTLRSESSKLPTTLRIGASSDVQRTDGIQLTLAGNIVSIIPEKSTHVLVGGEFGYDEFLFLRMGYASGYESRNITGGIGVRYGNVSVDYAHVPFRLDFGTTHTFSLAIEL